MFYGVIKLCFVLLLLFSFLFLMAWPSLQKFLSGGVIIEVSRIPKQKDGKPQIQELEPPAVTFCARNTTYWKNATLVVKNAMVKANCEKETNKEYFF